MRRLRLLAMVLAWTASVSIAFAQTKTVNSTNTPSRSTTNGAPSLTLPLTSSGIDLCLGEISGAYGSPMLAITLSVAQRDRVCSLLRQSKWAADLGDPELAFEIMCLSVDWRNASAKVGRPCR